MDLDYLVAFKKITWTALVVGVREKRSERNGQIIRLVEFAYPFVEEDWCTKAHIGYVLEGALTINFNGNNVQYEQGDGICIAAGKKHKHKAVLRKGEKALLLLFESK